MPTTLRLHGYEATDIHRYIELLIHNLVNIKDTTGRFLLKLDDGRIIDTKGQPSYRLPILWETILTRHRMERLGMDPRNRPLRTIPILRPNRLNNRTINNPTMVPRSPCRRNNKEHQHNVSLPHTSLPLRKEP
jgi:hypothetical protein